MTEKEARRIRKNSFASWFPYDDALAALLAGEGKQYEFLRLPVMQNIYLYQIEYVRRLCAAYFGDRPLKMLDWGCGKGVVSYWLRRAGLDVTSCDRNDGSGDSAFGGNNALLTKAGIDVVKIDHDWQMPFADASFDVVLSFGVLEHVKDDEKSLIEINRVLKSDTGGVKPVCFSVFTCRISFHTRRTLRTCGESGITSIFTASGRHGKKW